jgi:rhodanese-related sulfurtransferase
MFKRLVNLPFAVAGKAARAFQAREDARLAAAFGKAADPGMVANNTHVLPAVLTPAASVQMLVADLPGRAVHWIDVRDEAERAEWIDGATHMPMLTANVRVSELPPDETVVVYCDDGTRATQVACFFRDRGMEDTWALQGGLAAWKAAGRSTVGRT